MDSITLYDEMARHDPMQAITTLGQAFAKSGMLGVQTEAQGAVIAMACLVERKSPLDIVRTYHVIEGKLSKRADAMLAEFQQAGGRVQYTQSDAEVCEMDFRHADYQPEGVVVKVTLDELKKSGVAISSSGKLKDNYQKHPKNMLRARCISEGIRMVMPEIVAGVYTPEETSDFTERKAMVIPATPLLPEKEVVVEEDTESIAKFHDLLAHEGKDFFPAAKDFLVKLGWIDDKIADLPAHRAKEIIGKWESFAEKVRATMEGEK